MEPLETKMTLEDKLIMARERHGREFRSLFPLVPRGKYSWPWTDPLPPQPKGKSRGR